jgi:hypothetical protein
MGGYYPEPPEDQDDCFENMDDGYQPEEHGGPSLLDTLDRLRGKCGAVAARLKNGSRGGVASRAGRALGLSASALTRAAKQDSQDPRMRL